MCTHFEHGDYTTRMAALEAANGPRVGSTRRSWPEMLSFDDLKPGRLVVSRYLIDPSANETARITRGPHLIDQGANPTYVIEVEVIDPENLGPAEPDTDIWFLTDHGILPDDGEWSQWNWISAAPTPRRSPYKVIEDSINAVLAWAFTCRARPVH